jgi:hypothetical protein
MDLKGTSGHVTLHSFYCVNETKQRFDIFRTALCALLMPWKQTENFPSGVTLLYPSRI